MLDRVSGYISPCESRILPAIEAIGNVSEDEDHTIEV